jgi:hypothetical protein
MVRLLAFRLKKCGEMKKLWILAVFALGIAGAACNQGDPEPTVGDADITKTMPEHQDLPAAGKARANAPGSVAGMGKGTGEPEAGGGKTGEAGTMTPPPK